MKSGIRLLNDTFFLDKIPLDNPKYFIQALFELVL